MLSDRLATGLVAGLFAPLFGFFIYALIYVNVIRPHLDLTYFINDLFLGTRSYQSPVLTLSLIANLPVIFWFDRKDMPLAMRGVIFASFMYAIVIVTLWVLYNNG